MYFMPDIEYAEEIEKSLNEKHAIILIFAKPSDNIGREIINKINYYHHYGAKYCSIYLVGFMNKEKSKEYNDAIKINAIDNETWYYSDKCFVEVVRALEDRLGSWRYIGETQLILCQSNLQGINILNFQNYVDLDLAHGIREKYIPSIDRYLTVLIDASKKEVESYRLQSRTDERIKMRNIFEKSLDFLESPKREIKKILKDRKFYLYSRKKA